jgi:hypothetical protein
MKNVYFTYGTKSEQRLYEDLIIESLKIYGMDVYYLPREIVKEDKLFGEDVLSKFDENYMIEMYLGTYDGFEGDGTLFTKFGVRISDEATFIVSRRRWEDLVSSSYNLVSSDRPNEGDLIYFPLTKGLFQIKFVEHEIPFWQLGNVPTYQLRAELIEYSQERLETGIDEIDSISEDVGITLKLIMTAGSGDFDRQETVIGLTSGTTAKVVGWDNPSKTLELVDVTGSFLPNESVRGQSSSVTRVISTFSTLDMDLLNYAENKYIEDKGNIIVDFSESNPFGEYGDMGVF